jgi:threonylcarbamoyladenosine tRNA methylthiotransferase MtaB
MKKAAFFTLGCKVNQVETEQMKEEFIKKGYGITSFEENADIYIINTCTVTHVSDSKSRAIIRRALRKASPQAIVVAVGCLAQVNPEQLAEIEGIDLIVGNNQKENIAELVENYKKNKTSKPLIEAGPIDSARKPGTYSYTHPHEKTRAFIKIQDGCENFCSYCIVPFARGPVRSKNPAHVIAEIEQLHSLGYKEFVLTGIHTGLYGKDLLGWDLAKLLENVFNAVKGEYRIRLGSIEPHEVSAGLLEQFNHNQLCHHLHIPLQSGSDQVLKSMGRDYTRDYYSRLVEGIVSRIADMAVTADVMVGYPSEDSLAFDQTLTLLQKLPIMGLHVFRYSHRPGTRAAQLISVVSNEQKQERSKTLIQLANEKRHSFVEKMVGTKVRLLVEKEIKNDLYQGFSDNYINVLFSSRKKLTGQFVQVTIDHQENGKVWGTLTR